MKYRKTMMTWLIVAVMAMIAVPATAQDMDEPYEAPDDSWISISGTVTEADADMFMLDYGDGLITVEMDDFDTYGDAYAIMEGDNVVVFGRIDDDLYELRTIEAGSVFVENLNTQFYASPADEEDIGFLTVTVPVVPNKTTIKGTVVDIDEDIEEFTVETANREIVVDAGKLEYNPFDDEGFHQLYLGNRVSVTGTMGADFFEGQRLQADSIVSLNGISS